MMVRKALARSLREMAGRGGVGQGRGYTEGVWLGDPACFRCSVAPAVPAAVLARLDGRTSPWLPVAERTVDRAIADHRQQNGSFVPAKGAEFRYQITTMFVGTYIATAYLQLKPYLSSERRARWRAAVAGAARWVIPELTYYVNGNVNLGNTVLMYLAFRVTHSLAFLRAYRRSLRFTLTPPTSWPGYGLDYFRHPQRADGADGSGYLAESLPAGKPGFDTNYTMVQADHAARLYALSRVPAALRLLNLLTNTLVDRANHKTWQMATLNDSRHPNRASVVQLVTPALPIAALAAGRTDLWRFVQPQLEQSLLNFHSLLVQGPGNQDRVAEFATALIALEPPRVAGG